MKGWRERVADIFTKHGEIAAKMKSAPGPGTTDLGYSTTPHPTKGVRPRARFYSTKGVSPSPSPSPSSISSIFTCPWKYGTIRMFSFKDARPLGGERNETT